MSKKFFSFICFLVVAAITILGFVLFGWSIYLILWQGEILSGISLGGVSILYNRLVKPVSIISTSLFNGPEYKWM